MGARFRVPTPDASVTDFTAVLEKDATVGCDQCGVQRSCVGLKATKGLSNTAMKRSFRKISWAIHTPAFSTAN